MTSDDLVHMLSSELSKAATHAAGALWFLAAIGTNKEKIAAAGGIAPLVALLAHGTAEAQRFAAGALWHLAAVGDNKSAMVGAGAIPPLVALLASESAEASEYAAAVLSMLARSQGGPKKAIVQAGGVAPLVVLLSDQVCLPLMTSLIACAPPLRPGVLASGCASSSHRMTLHPFVT